MALPKWSAHLNVACKSRPNNIATAENIEEKSEIIFHSGITCDTIFFLYISTCSILDAKSTFGMIDERRNASNLVSMQFIFIVSLLTQFVNSCADPKNE